MSKTGSCLCGAVRYIVDPKTQSMGACHCSMCRKWSGGVYLGMEAAADQMTFEGVENIASYTSSDWAERAFCKTCGSNLYYRVTAPGSHHGTFHFAFGTLDDPGDTPLTSELFIDAKPSGYSFAETTEALTTEEVMVMFAALDSN